ncbi:MAG: sigma-70 family RNA polymerase sigma factor [Planctomycetes bacterium]|nr:sigma-70 family RNA polymerase sigma factor [Planctomycetota bacterium]
MPKFFNHDLADLAHQLTLSPRRLRLEQLRAIDALLGIVEPNRAYPYDFVCYRITKYRKRGDTTGPSIPGKALVCDLVTMAEVLSRKANLTAGEIAEPYKTHQELAEALEVSTKTVRRWRNRGLMGLRVVFPDGVNRLAFCRSTIDRFVSANRELVERGAAFKQLSGAERDRIVDRAREILAQRRMKLHAIARVISEETGRAVETVRYTLRRYDEAHPECALFAAAACSAREERQEAMWRCSQAGEPLESIARAFDCTVTEVEAVLRCVQTRRWAQAPLEPVYNELFDAPDADALILGAPEPPAYDGPPQRIPRDLPPYLRSLYLTPLLTREQEQDLFRRYNYLKFKAGRCLRAVDLDDVTQEQFETLRGLLAQVEAIRQRIIRANLRLVVSIAKRHVGWAANFFEVVSDGNMSLMRAIEKFDYAMGNKFSTYASWAIMKNYARSIPEQHYQAARFMTGQDLALESAPDERPTAASPSDRDRVRDLIAAGLSELPTREQEVLREHFGLNDGAATTTLEQLGKRFGVTKERVRQIERRALARLREVLAPTITDAIAD